MSEPLRLFLSLYPDDAALPALSALAKSLQRECGGRAMEAPALHLTLAFLGDTPPDRVAPLRTVLEAVRFEPFTLSLDRVGRWDSGVVWLSSSQRCPPLAALAESVRTVLREARVDFDRKRFTPHITLVRRSLRPGRTHEIEPIGWRTDRFTLVRSHLSHQGSRYDDLAVFPASGAVEVAADGGAV